MSGAAARILAPVSVGVMGSGTASHEELAGPLGEMLARLGVNLVTGGGGGAMRAVARAYVLAPRERGLCIGILPCTSLEERGRPAAGYPNEFIELPIATHLPFSGELGTSDLSRNHINVLSSAAIVALPGGAGTASEVVLALRYGRPVLVYAADPAAVAHYPAGAPRARTLDEVERFLRPHIVPPARA